MWPGQLALLAAVGCGGAANAPRRAITVEPTAEIAAAPAADPHTAAPVYLSAGLPDGEAALEEGWLRWSQRARPSFDALFEIAVLANRARPLATADNLMVQALGEAVAVSGCDPERLGKVRLLAIAVAGANHPPELDDELAWLADVGPVECSAVRR